MSRSDQNTYDVVPARLSFLTIYNPSLSHNDDDVDEQILYFYSLKEKESAASKGASSKGNDAVRKEARSERLRQVGLAQGMVNFAKDFSKGEIIDAIESEKSRTLIHELEPGWWILASIDLTVLRTPTNPDATRISAAKDTIRTEFSAREVCPQSLLTQQVLRAHAIFLLHHAPSLEDLFARLTRTRFTAALDRFWSTFIHNWEVLLNGNPAVDVFNGIKLAAGGELGIGVGEEEWGSGEREVLEGFIGRTGGLVDLIVSRFGEAAQDVDQRSLSSKKPAVIKADVNSQQWLGIGSYPGVSDGVIFSGLGAVSRKTLRSISAWTEWLYQYGHQAYGVESHPNSARRKKRRKADNRTAERSEDTEGTPSVPPSMFQARKIPITAPLVDQDQNPLAVSHTSSKERNLQTASGRTETKSSEEETGTETLVKYLTLGVYGSSWGIPFNRAQPTRQQSVDAGAVVLAENESIQKSIGQDLKSIEDSVAKAVSANDGFFLIGLKGNLEADDLIEEEDGPPNDFGSETEALNQRFVLRSLHVERNRGEMENPDSNTLSPGAVTLKDSTFERLRVVVYVHRPFIFTFLFELATDSLSMSSLYKSLHHQLGPLQQSLLSSTSPAKVHQRLREAGAPLGTSSLDNAQPIYDLVYDPHNLTVHTTIPSIPESGTAAAEGLLAIENPWTRIEALNVHSQILHIHLSTRQRLSEVERTGKTSRGWWVVWMRLPLSSLPFDLGAGACREAILVRKASDQKPVSALRKASSAFGARDTSSSSGWGPGRLTEGIGIDTRKYIEGLLSLNR